LPDNTSEVEYIIFLTHRTGEGVEYTEVGGNEGTRIGANEIVDIVVYKSDPLSGSFKKFKSNVSVESEMPTFTTSDIGTAVIVVDPGADRSRNVRLFAIDESKLIDPVIESIEYLVTLKKAF